MSTPSVGVIGSLIRFKITFDEVLEELVFEDQSQTIYSTYGYSSVKGLLWITHSTKGTIYKNSGYDASSFTSPDTLSGLLTKTISYSEAVKGTYTINYKVSHDDGISISSKSYVFNSSYPSMTVTKNVNYDISTLTITDTSSYQIGIGIRSPQTALFPSVVTRYVKVRFPIGASVDEFEDENASEVTTIGPPIYTTNYDLEVATTLIYQMEKWDNNYWIEWKIVTTKYDSFNVEITDNCINSCISCIYQLSEKLASARGRSQREADYYERLVYDISFYYGLYRMYKEADLDTGYACEKIKAILRKECTIESTTSTTPVVITPLYNTTGTSIPGADGSTWHSGTSSPSNSLGVNGDFYLCTANGYIYKKESGIWVNIMTLSIVGERVIKTITASQTLLITDDIVFIKSLHASGNTVPPVPESLSDFSGLAVTLPQVNEGHEITLVAETLIKPIAVLPNNSAYTIENESVYLFGTEGDSIHLVLKGTNWKIL